MRLDERRDDTAVLYEMMIRRDGGKSLKIRTKRHGGAIVPLRILLVAWWHL